MSDRDGDGTDHDPDSDPESTSETDPGPGSAPESDPGPGSAPETDPGPGSAPETDPEPETASKSDPGPETASEPGSEPESGPDTHPVGPVDENGDEDADPDLTTGLRSLHPRVQIVWVVRAAILAGILTTPMVGAHVYLGVTQWVPIGGGAAVLTLLVAHALLRYRRWSYVIREDDLYLERGVITRVRTVVPLVRIQHVDSRRGPVERAIGLASCVVYTAGSRGADVRIPGLTPAGADDLRERLKRLAIRAEGEDAV